MIATLLAWKLTGESRYADWHWQVHEWAFRHFADSQHGEWYGYLRRDGGLTTPLKGNLWKGPFHLPRMQLTCWQILADACDRQ
jgi:N-acylglucosamine 2-epimerase